MVELGSSNDPTPPWPRMMSRLVRLFVLVVALQSLPVALAAEEYVQITGDRVNVRFWPSTASRVVAQARRGDIFKLYDILDQWYGINLFAGHTRYLHRSLAKVVDYRPELPEDAVRYSIFHAAVGAERRSREDADAEFPSRDSSYRLIPGNPDKRSKYRRILQDRYILQIYHDHGLQPPLYRIIRGEGLTKGWLN